MTAVVTPMIPKCRPKFSLGLPPRLLGDVTVVSVTPVSYSAPLFPNCSQGPTPIATTPISRPIFGANLVAPHVFVGAAVDACDLKTLQEHDIRYVLNLAADCQPDAAVVAGVHYLHVPLADTVEAQADARARFDDIHAFIRSGVASGHNVLVHCFLGLSRGPTAALAYITAETIARGDRCGCNADAQADDGPRRILYTALAAMQAARANVLPNAGFMEALADWCRTRVASHAAAACFSDDGSSYLTRAETMSIEKCEMSRTATAVGMTAADRTLSMHSCASY